MFFFFFSCRRRHTISLRDWSSDVCSSDLTAFSTLLSRYRLDFVSRSSRASCSPVEAPEGTMARSEERRVGKECRSGWAPEHERKKGAWFIMADNLESYQAEWIT